MRPDTYTKAGSKASVASKLDPSIFDVDTVAHNVLHHAYLAYLANKRPNLAKTLRRGEVRGGGRKPWKQKGTGRARFGSIRVPIWRGGGIVFGPSGKENYSRKLTIKTKRQALAQALTLSLKEGKLKIIETFECKTGKVKPTLGLIRKMGISGNILLVVSVKDKLVERATSNIVGLKATDARYLNAYDIINADYIVISQKSLEIIGRTIGAKNE